MSSIRMLLLAAGAAGSFAAAAPAAAGSADWQRSVAQAVAAKQVYPRSALSREIEGNARVRVTVDRSGGIAGYEVVQATGHSVLDNEIVKLLDRVNPLPTPPAEVADAELTFVLPLSWVLR